jgi:hypothetical protein
MIGVKILDSQSLPTTPSIRIAGFGFDGPFASCLDCKEEPGILAILELKPGRNFVVINLYQSANIRSSAYLELSYYVQSQTKILVATLYTKDSSAQVGSNLATRLLESVSQLAL